MQTPLQSRLSPIHNKPDSKQAKKTKQKSLKENILIRLYSGVHGNQFSFGKAGVRRSALAKGAKGIFSVLFI